MFGKASTDRDTQAMRPTPVRIVASRNCQRHILARAWRHLFPARGFFAALEIPGDVRGSILQSAILSPLSTPGCKTGRLDGAFAKQFLAAYLPEIAADIEKGTRLVPEVLWFSMSYEPGLPPAEGRTSVAVATPEELMYLPLPIRWERRYRSIFPCEDFIKIPARSHLERNP